LVALARAKHPIPSRTRPLSAAAPMVLRLKTWESRSPPNLLSTQQILLSDDTTISGSFCGLPITKQHYARKSRAYCKHAKIVAGWSSPVARQAHNLKVIGSNPIPATKIRSNINTLHGALSWPVCLLAFMSTIGQHLTRRCDAGLLFAGSAHSVSGRDQDRCTRLLSAQWGLARSGHQDADGDPAGTKKPTVELGLRV
jgi:hypothetical protein